MRLLGPCSGFGGIVALVLVGCGTPLPPTAAPSPASPPEAAAGPSASPPGGSASPSGGPVATGSPTQARIDALLDRIAADPSDGEAQRDLGFALLQRVRETADTSLHALAEAAFRDAGRLRPDDPLVASGLAALHLARHDFAAALASARQARRLDPGLPAALAIETDALVELGRYDEALDVAQRLLDAGETIVSLARVSYLRELHGDVDGAIAAMTEATAAPAVAPENTAYLEVLLGDLLVLAGREADAAAAYRRARALVRDHPGALAGEARAALRRGDVDDAVVLLERVVATVPLPDHVIALGEARELAGDGAGAREAYDLARAQIALMEATGTTVDVELALFEADHGDPDAAVRLARAAYRDRATIHTADALAWALHRAGRPGDAQPLVEEALRLGTQDPRLLHHAGAIAAALGDEDGARRLLRRALELDAGFSATGARSARELLATLEE